ncbi:MAG: hypothetical protein FJZ88_08395 [Chloroflexi bacterium]|nr:hypothetical protein [Chloroflexota bacterium]
MEDFQKQMVTMWRSSWETYVKTLSTMQEQGDKMLELFFTQSETLQDEAKSLVKDWVSNIKEAQKTYIQTVEENLKKIEDQLGTK